MSNERKTLSAFELEAEIAENLIVQYFKEYHHYNKPWNEVTGMWAKILCGKIRNDLIETLERMKRMNLIRYWLFCIQWKKGLNFIIEKGA